MWVGMVASHAMSWENGITTGAMLGLHLWVTRLKAKAKARSEEEAGSSAANRAFAILRSE
jgi:hypothetical protein